MLAHVRRVRDAYKILVVEPERKRILGRPRLNWKDNIQMGLGESCDRVWIEITSCTIGAVGMFL